MGRKPNQHPNFFVFRWGDETESLMVVKMSTTLDSQEDTTPPPIVPAATSFVVSFDPPQPPANCRPNKFVKRHMRNLSLPVANVYCTENNNKVTFKFYLIRPATQWMKITTR